MTYLSLFEKLEILFEYLIYTESPYDKICQTHAQKIAPHI